MGEQSEKYTIEILKKKFKLDKNNQNDASKLENVLITHPTIYFEKIYHSVKDLDWFLNHSFNYYFNDVRIFKFSYKRLMKIMTRHLELC